MKRTMEHTIAALKTFDAGAEEREKAWYSVESNADVDAAEKADRDALELVQRAYHKDTNDINCLDNCLRCDLAFMRRMAVEL